MGSVLNLVFDKWENGEEIDNLKEYKQYGYHNIRIDDYLNTFNVKNYKKYNISDINNYPDKKFYYLIHNFFIPDIKNNNENKYNISNLVINELQKNANFYLIFFNDQESESISELFLIRDFCINYRIKQNKIWLCNNNSKILELKDSFNFSFNMHITKNLSLLVREVDKKNNMNIKHKKIKNNLFLCLNHTPRQHRLLLLSLLKKYNILNDTDWSLLEGPLKNGSEYDINSLYEPLKNYKIFEKDINYIYNINFKLCDYDKKHNKKISNWMDMMSSEIFENSYFNIITETNFFEYDIIHITEKSFKPFNYYQFPLFLATHHHVKYMKKNYDLDFFDDVIDHSYDNVIDNGDRLFKLVEEIKRIQENKDFFIDFYKKNKDRFLENYKKYISLDDHHDYNFFNNLSQ